VVTASQRKNSNPFVVTKAVDLTDDQIQELWVDVVSTTDAMAELARPSSPMPTYVLGGKGSGKTHLMRYHAFELQTLRYQRDSLSLRTGIAQDGYVGMYLRCSGLNAGRFGGKRQSPELWNEVFAYYMELWLAQSLLKVLIALGAGKEDGDEKELAAVIMGQFDSEPEEIPTGLEEIVSLLSKLQKELDYQVNNCIVSGKLEPSILVTRGNLIFGIPKLITKRYLFLRDVMFVYSMDEFENLTINQQAFINTLVRERELPVTIRVGGRLYGVKTWHTNSAEEEILQNSEYELLPLDERFRAHKKKYKDFSHAIIHKRLLAAFEATMRLPDLEVHEHLTRIFDIPDHSSWRSEEFLDIVGPGGSENRRHFEILREKLNSIQPMGVRSRREIDLVVQRLSSQRFPLLEKLNTLILYQDWSNGKNVFQSSEAISFSCKEFVAREQQRGRYASALGHFKSDLIAQMLRENGRKQDYSGLQSFIDMSAGLPRALLTILKYVFDWSAFNGEEPFTNQRVSTDAQQRGVKDASDWFYENMRKAGPDGAIIQASIDRLANLFRINRFGDKPIECSLIAFSLDEHAVSQEALRVVKLAESRSFLIRVPGGQRDRNSERITMKLQLNNMLAPRWDLPIARRGAINLKPAEVNAIFDPARTDEYQLVYRDWTERTNAPFPTKKPNTKERQGVLF
jgi:hypothetical protein